MHAWVFCVFGKEREELCFLFVCDILKRISNSNSSNNNQENKIEFLISFWVGVSTDLRLLFWLFFLWFKVELNQKNFFLLLIKHNKLTGAEQNQQIHAYNASIKNGKKQKNNNNIVLATPNHIVLFMVLGGFSCCCWCKLKF